MSAHVTGEDLSPDAVVVRRKMAHAYMHVASCTLVPAGTPEAEVESIIEHRTKMWSHGYSRRFDCEWDDNEAGSIILACGDLLSRFCVEIGFDADECDDDELLALRLLVGAVAGRSDPQFFAERIYDLTLASPPGAVVACLPAMIRFTRDMVHQLLWGDDG